MNWSNVKLIFFREVRDQLRDRRTLFMIAVLPVLLYPLVGMSMFQVTQVLREHPVRVLVIGVPESHELPALIEDGHFASRFLADPASQSQLELTLESAPETPVASPEELLVQARDQMQKGNYEIVVYFPADFAEAFATYHQSLIDTREAAPGRPNVAMPNIEVFPNLAKDSSLDGYRKVMDVLARWRDDIGRRNLEDTQVIATAARPFDIATVDVAEQEQHKALLWSKILPFVLLIWALTGAFYPAVDLCAGEKERGTLETLLSSPAERQEIVWGKLLTVALFSFLTSLLNVASLAITGAFALSAMPNLGAPPTFAIFWLMIALVPMSALFAALSLALAAFARSTKEGQYYLMPLVLVMMPLVLLPIAPGVTLNLGNSLIPVTGMMLLLRSVLEGNYAIAIPYLLPVLAITFACLWLAVRWATRQFNSEAVLFRESERWDLRIWLKQTLRERGTTPSFGQAIFCGMLILLIRFFIGFALPAPQNWNDFSLLVIVTAVGVIALPALAMTLLVTRNATETLLLRQPARWAVPAAVLLACALSPVANALQVLVTWAYPLDARVVAELNGLLLNPPNLWALLVTLAVVPAVCEELAFRGFVLSGLRHSGSKWGAIIVSSVFFGAAHALFQQSVVATLVGIVIGFLAVQSGSLLPCILFHVTHNSLALLVQQSLPKLDEAHPLRWLLRSAAEDGPLYSWPVIVCSAAVAAAILNWFHKLPYTRTVEESVQQAIDREASLVSG